MISRLLFAFVVALPFFAGAQDAAFTNRSTDLRERAEADARAVTRLSENTPVKVLGRAGAWTRVEAGGQSGYVNAFHLRFAASVDRSAPSSSGGGVLSSIGSAVTGQRANPKANLATTGVRGLSKEQLRDSNPDPEQLRRMQSYRADRASAERFAREGKLAAVQVDAPPDEASAPPPPPRSRR